MSGISVTAAEDRPTRAEQIQTLCSLIPPTGSIRLRIPAQLWDEERQQYPALRDAAWTISIHKDALTPETIEEMLTALGAAIRCIGEQGAAETLKRLAGTLQ